MKATNLLVSFTRTPTCHSLWYPGGIKALQWITKGGELRSNTETDFEQPKPTIREIQQSTWTGMLHRGPQHNAEIAIHILPDSRRYHKYQEYEKSTWDQTIPLLRCWYRRYTIHTHSVKGLVSVSLVLEVQTVRSGRRQWVDLLLNVSVACQ